MQQNNRRFPVIAVLAAMVLVVAMAALALAKPNTLVRAEIPAQYKWDLNDIYPDWTAWEADLARLENVMDRYAALQGTLAQGPEQLLRSYLLGDTLGMLAYKVYQYPSLSSVTDTRNNEIAAKLQQVQILFGKFSVATAWFNPELLAIPWETTEKWLNETPALAPYRYSIENLYRQQQHVLNEEQEQLLSYFSQFRGTPASIYQELSTSDIRFPEVVLSGGDTVTMTAGQYYSTLSTNRNQADRAAAFQQYYGIYHANANTYAATYNSILQRDWGTAQARKYGSTLETYLDDDNVPTSVYENLVNIVKAGTAPVHRYYQLRKKALGLETYHGYDGSIPVVDFDKVYDYDEITGWIVESVAPLGADYQAKMKQAFAGGWIDVFENEGKRGGAFSAGVYGVHPYMLLNYNETLREAFTVAHEAGHTLHTMLSNENQPFATADYTIFVAEVASTLNEALFLDYMMEKSQDPKERIALLQQTIDNIIGTFYTQVMFADFEWQAHKLAEQGQPITADALTELYTGLWKTYQGDAVVFDDLYGSTWTRIAHFYRTPYYVYKYATCFASSAKLAEDIRSADKAVRAAAIDRYMTLLKAGGSDYPMELLKKAGVDLTQPETFQAVIEHVDKLVTRLEEELAKL